MSDVKQEWVEATRFVLARYASEQQTVTYGELYDHLREVHFPSWPARAGYHWMSAYIAPILSEVASLNRIHDEPILTALVRGADTGHVSTGYQTAVMNRYGYTVERFTLHAQVETGKCFRVFGTPK